jgi:hypothetical protein
MWPKCMISAAVMVSASAAFASTPTDPAQKATAANSTLVQFAQNRGQQQQRPAPRAAPSNVHRPPMVRPQQPAGQRGQMQRGVRPGAQGAPNRSVSGVTGPGAHGMRGATGGGTGVATPQSPRSQLYDLVRPAPVQTNLGKPAQGPGNVTRSAPAGAHVPKSAAFAKPANVPHNSSRNAGTAVQKHSQRRFVVRRAGYAYYRHYYDVSGAWYR